jgi:hypothetical protein
LESEASDAATSLIECLGLVSLALGMMLLLTFPLFLVQARRTKTVPVLIEILALAVAIMALTTSAQSVITRALFDNANLAEIVDSILPTLILVICSVVIILAIVLVWRIAMQRDGGAIVAAVILLLFAIAGAGIGYMMLQGQSGYDDNFNCSDVLGYINDSVLEDLGCTYKF